jgi:hypothetical protein
MRALLSCPLILAAWLSAAESAYFEFAVDQDRLGPDVDFSFLNQPLGPGDRVFVDGAEFRTLGSDLKPRTRDDKPIRFFGVNLAFGGNFPEERDAERIARRLRRLGVNIVRLHHLDTSPDVQPEAARSILTTGPYPTFNPVAVARLRRFIDALAAEGIYINLNLKVGYLFRPEVDWVPAPATGPMPTQSKPLHIFHPRMVELQVEYARRLIEALGLKGQPALAMVEISNESSLVWAWQRGQLDRYLTGAYREELERQWSAFLTARRGAPAQVPLVPETSGGPEELINEYLLFLAETDRAYLNRMAAAVREATDALTPITGTQMGFGGLLNLDSHRDLDYMDEHFYIDHYNFPNRSWDPRDWRIRDSSATGSGLATYLQVAAARQAGRPYTVSEFNQNWPNRYAAELDPTIAAFGAFQGWNGLMHFAYAHAAHWDLETPSGFDLVSDHTKLVAFGQAAWLFRSGAIRPGRRHVALPVPLELRLAAARARRIRDIPNLLEEKLGFAPETIFIHPVRLRADGAGRLPERARSRPQPPYRADTGELSFDPRRKLLLIHAPEAAGMFGFAGHEPLASGPIELQLAPSSRGFAAVLVTALDGRPIRESRRLLVTTPGYTLRSKAGTNPPEPQRLVFYPGTKDWWTLEPDPEEPGKPSGNRGGGRGPVWMERVESRLTVRTSARRITVYPLDGAGARRQPLEEKFVSPVAGGFQIHLQADGAPTAPWYVIVAGR